MTMVSRPQLYIDLDGVLCDFNSGVVNVSGKRPSEFRTQSDMWRRLMRAKNFYATLPWMMPYGPKLWNLVKDIEPIILTDLPRGKWAEPQKREWCAQHLGSNVRVHTCLSRDKAKFASQEGDILIDDRLDNCQDWREAGGTAFHWSNQEYHFPQLEILLKQHHFFFSEQYLNK